MGFTPAERADFFVRAQELLGGSNLLAEGYFAWLKAQGEGSDDADAASVVWGGVPENEPFLSVICRTQGTRAAELREALGSLQKQSCRDFQLIVVGHNVDEAARSRVEACLDELEDWMKARTVFLQVSGGTRSRPLNAALPFVAGRYFSVFDEDDLVYENWVSSFAALASDYPHHVFYCFVETQLWRAQEDEQGQRVLTPEADEIGLHYCKHPSDLELLVGNHCPFMGLSFPSELVHEWGFRFNEGLQTTEDWDFFMRARNVYPFKSSDAHVALYRLWSLKGGNSSDTVSSERWERDRDAVQSAKAQAPLLFAPGFSEQARQVLGDATSVQSFTAAHMDLFLDRGKGFDPRYCAKPVLVPGGADTYRFTDLNRFGPVTALRVDPVPHGPFALESYSLEVHLADGASFTIEPIDTRINGRVVGGQFEFPCDDPQIECVLPAPETLDYVVFRFKRSYCFVQEDESDSQRDGKLGRVRSLVNRVRR